MRIKTIIVFIFTVILMYTNAAAADLSPQLRFHYQELRNEIYGNYLSNRNYKNLRFYIAACLHDLSSLQWKTCMNYKKRYGDCNAPVTNELHRLARSIMSKPGRVSGIQKIYNYVNSAILYEAETQNVPQFPYETLYRRKGDCEDQAILLATLLRIVGYDSALVRFADSRKDFYHVICVVKTTTQDARTPLFRFGRYTNEGYSWKILDPAYNHSYHQLPKWVNNYRTKNGYTFPSGITRMLKINRNEYYDLCDQADQKGRYRKY